MRGEQEGRSLADGTWRRWDPPSPAVKTEAGPQRRAGGFCSERQGGDPSPPARSAILWNLGLEQGHSVWTSDPQNDEALYLHCFKPLFVVTCDSSKGH